jgi:hypothetical protein
MAGERAARNAERLLLRSGEVVTSHQQVRRVDQKAKWRWTIPPSSVHLGIPMKMRNKNSRKGMTIHVSFITYFLFLFFTFPSADEFFLNEASPKRLNKLLKKKLVELYALTGLTEFVDSLKKSEIVDAIINARDDVPLAPPSSPGRTECASSEYLSSDDGNAAGDETDTPDSPDARHPGGQLIRRATMHDVSKLTPRPRNTKGRSASMGNTLGHGESSNSHVDRTLEKPRYVVITRVVESTC